MNLNWLRKIEVKISTREAFTGYAFVMIWIIGFLAFTLYPLVQTFMYSLNNVTVTISGIDLEYVKWANYTKALFADPKFVEVLIDYAIQTVLSVPIIIIFSLIIALLLNVNFKLRGLFRTIFFLPVVITSGPVIVELTQQGATSAPGVANSTTIAAFIASLPPSLRGSFQFLLSSFILILWFSGVQILIYLASLQKIDKSIYEAAAIDGASAWEAFWKITLPSLSAPTMVIAIYTIITLSQFSENAVIKYIGNQTYNPQGGIGYASAMSFLYFTVLVLLLTIIYLIRSFRGKNRLD